MIPFLKRKIPAETVGRSLLYIADWKHPPTAERIKASLGMIGDEEIDRVKYQTEIIFLTAFTIDYVVTMTLGEGPTTQAILRAYYDAFEERGKENLLWADIFRVLKSRSIEYSMAVRNPHPEYGVPYAVGRAFSEICGAPLSARVMLAGSAHFASTFRMVSKVLNSYKVV